MTERYSPPLRGCDLFPEYRRWLRPTTSQPSVRLQSTAGIPRKNAGSTTEYVRSRVRRHRRVTTEIGAERTKPTQALR